VAGVWLRRATEMEIIGALWGNVASGEWMSSFLAAHYGLFSAVKLDESKLM